MNSLTSILLIIVISSSWQNSLAIEEHGPSDIESQIWSLEETYITAYKNAEHAKILALLHKQFLGWPDPQKRTTAYSQVAGFLQDKYAAPGIWSYEIDQAGIQGGGQFLLGFESNRTVGAQWKATTHFFGDLLASDRS